MTLLLFLQIKIGESNFQFFQTVILALKKAKNLLLWPECIVCRWRWQLGHIALLLRFSWHITQCGTTWLFIVESIELHYKHCHAFSFSHLFYVNAVIYLVRSYFLVPPFTNVSRPTRGAPPSLRNRDLGGAAGRNYVTFCDVYNQKHVIGNCGKYVRKNIIMKTSKNCCQCKSRKVY